MSAPYRRAGQASTTQEGSERRYDDRVLGILMMVLGGVRVALGLVQHEHFGFDATLAALVVCAGFAVFPWR